MVYNHDLQNIKISLVLQVAKIKSYDKVVGVIMGYSMLDVDCNLLTCNVLKCFKDVTMICVMSLSKDLLSKIVFVRYSPLCYHPVTIAGSRNGCDIELEIYSIYTGLLIATCVKYSHLGLGWLNLLQSLLRLTMQVSKLIFCLTVARRVLKISSFQPQPLLQYIFLGCLYVIKHLARISTKYFT